MPDSATPWTVACQAPLSMEFSRQDYWSGLLFPSPGDLPHPGMEPGSPALQADSLPTKPLGKSLIWVLGIISSFTDHNNLLRWQLVFLPGEFHGQRSLAGYSPWGCKESDMTNTFTHICFTNGQSAQVTQLAVTCLWSREPRCPGQCWRYISKLTEFCF